MSHTKMRPFWSTARMLHQRQAVSSSTAAKGIQSGVILGKDTEIYPIKTVSKLEILTIRFN